MGFGPELLIPLAIGAATSGAGALMTSNANKQQAQNSVNEANKRNQQLDEYRNRMKELQGESQDNAAKTMAQFTPEATAKRETEATTTLEDQYAKDTAAPAMPTAVDPGGSNPTVTGAATAEAKAKTDAYTKMLSKRLAALGTQPQALLGSGIGIQRGNSANDMFGNFGKQETSLLPNYQDFASTYYKLKPKVGSPGGEALTGLGSTMMSMAGSNFSGFGGGGSTAVPLGKFGRN